MNVFEKLSAVQSEVKATKDAYNNFGKYNYRTCESILEAVKPILKYYNCSIVLRDEIVNIGERFYIKATAELIDCENECKTVSVSAFAREEETKKGMDGAQVTGSSSSYARKYALAGLLLLDDNKDPDSTNKHGKDDKSNEGTKVSDNDIAMIKSIMAVYPKEQAETTMKVKLTQYKVNSLEELTKPQFVKLREELLNNASVIMQKRFDKMVSDFAKKANSDTETAKMVIETGIGRKLADITIAEFNQYKQKIQEMYKDLNANG